MILPDWIAYAAAENSAAALYRGLTEKAASWGELIAQAQAVMGFFQDQTLAELDQLYDEQKAAPLIAAARVLDTAALIYRGRDDEASTYLATTAAMCFAMYGNFPSANAVIRRTFSSFVKLSPGELAIVGSAAPTCVPELIPLAPQDSTARLYLESISAFLSTGDRQLADDLPTLLKKCRKDAQTDLERGLLLSARLVLGHMQTLSVAAQLKKLEHLPASYVSQLVDSNVKLLLPPQYRAIHIHRLIASESDSLVALPPSTGKTLLGELCLVAALKGRPGIVCFLAPYRALARQVARSFRRHIPPPFRIRLLSGGTDSIPKLEPNSKLEIVIATPERLDSLLRSMPEIISSIRCIVCDEAHLIEDRVRGVRLEGILTRLKLLKLQGHSIRLLLISAVLSGYDAFKNWINIADGSLVIDSWRPTARRLAIWKQTGTLDWYLRGDTLHAPGAHGGSLLGSLTLEWPKNDFFPATHFGAKRKLQGSVYENVAFLVKTLHAKYAEASLCLCGTKAGTRHLAFALAKILPIADPLPDGIGKILALIRSMFPHLRSLGECLRRRTAYHNAAVPDAVLDLIEKAVDAREMVAVAATTTLAEGVDLPFRFTIIVDWLQWDGQRDNPIGSLLFRNVAGRCGRAGIFTEGDTIIVDNPVGDPEFTNAAVRGRFLERKYLGPGPEELKSVLENLDLTGPGDAIRAELGSQFLASIPENTNQNDLVTAFASNSFASRSPSGSSHLARHLRAVRESILADDGDPLATAASPLQLTPFGKAANVTGLSPDSCRKVLHFLRTAAATSGVGDLGEKLILELGLIPEQANAGIKKVLLGRQNKFCVKANDLRPVIEMWLNGSPEVQMFASLRQVKNSKRAGFNDWVSGEAQVPDWDDSYETFVDFISSVLQVFLPSSLHACESLSAIASGWATSFDWQLAGRMFEHGVDTAWACTAIRKGAPGGRTAIAQVGRGWPLDLCTADDRLGLSALREPSGAAGIQLLVDELVKSAGGLQTITGENLMRLYQWLSQQID
jgi:helicase